MPALLIVFLIAYVLVEAGREVRAEAAARIGPGLDGVRSAVDSRLGRLASHPAGRYVATAARLGLGLFRGLANVLVFGAALTGAAVRGGRRGVRRTRDWYADQIARRDTGHGEVPGEVIDVGPADEAWDSDDDLADPDDTAQCPTCGGWLVTTDAVCLRCQARQRARTEDHDRRQADQQNGDPAMTDVPEVNFESTIAQLDALDQKMTQLDQATETLETLRTEIREETQTLAEMLAAVNIDSATLAGLTEVVDGLSPQHIDPLVQAHEAGTAALAATRENVIATYADAADTVATTGVDAPFLQPA